MGLRRVGCSAIAALGIDARARAAAGVMAAPMATDGGGVGGGCIYNYHVTAHKPTAVRHCAVGSFTSPADINLIIG